MPLLERMCASCGRSYALLARGWDKSKQDFREVIAVDHQDPAHLTCPECGEAQWVYPASFFGPTAPTMDSRMYPYFDRGLGCEVRTPAHRRWLLSHTPDGKERPSRLIPMEGEMQTFQDMGEREMSARVDLDKHLAAEAKKQQDDPDIRKAADVIRQMAENKELHTLFKGVDRAKARVDSSY
jgi:hypothetical protein